MVTKIGKNYNFGTHPIVFLQISPISMIGTLNFLSDIIEG